MLRATSVFLFVFSVSLFIIAYILRKEETYIKFLKTYLKFFGITFDPAATPQNQKFEPMQQSENLSESQAANPTDTSFTIPHSAMLPLLRQRYILLGILLFMGTLIGVTSLFILRLSTL